MLHVAKVDASFGAETRRLEQQFECNFTALNLQIMFTLAAHTKKEHSNPLQVTLINKFMYKPNHLGAVSMVTHAE